MLISRTPYRLSLYGGGLDYPEWFNTSKATILCAGLDYYCYLTVRRLPPFFKHNYRAAYSKIETTEKLDDIKHPSVREVFKKYGMGKPLEISHIGDLPAKSGIGSSSAFTVGLINSLTALNGEYLGRTALAEAAISIEQGEMGEKVGIQDQCAAAFGGLVLVEADADGIKPRKFISRPEYTSYICNSLLMGFDGNERFSSHASSKTTRRLTEKSSFEIMQELSKINEAGINSFGKEEDIENHAKMTRLARDIKLELNGDSANTQIMSLIEATERAGSLCTRIMGAGGGGFFVCWAPEYRHDKIKGSVNIRNWVKVKFSRTGSQIIFSEL